MSRDELEQIYRMRTLLERELLDTARAADDVKLAELRASNVTVAATMRTGSVVEMLRSNTAFHFAIFELSPLAFVRQEVLRLWRLSEPYQAAYLRHPLARERILAEHDAIIDAAASGDSMALVALIDAHRAAAMTNVLGMLPPKSPGSEADRGDVGRRSESTYTASTKNPKPR
jgi:DNA-binding GntR family transcriptional regulator